MKSPKAFLLILNAIAVATLVCLQAVPAAAEGSFERTLAVTGAVRLD